MIKLGQSCLALNIGIAEETPYFLAAYEHVETIPPRPSWPIATGLFSNEGSLISSHLAKKALRSIWTITLLIPTLYMRMRIMLTNIIGKIKSCRNRTLFVIQSIISTKKPLVKYYENYLFSMTFSTFSSASFKAFSNFLMISWPSL